MGHTAASCRQLGKEAALCRQVRGWELKELPCVDVAESQDAAGIVVPGC